jgi:hypothetical protein
MGIGAAASYLTLSGDVSSKNSNDTDAGESSADSDQKVRFSFSNTILSIPIYMGFHVAESFTIVLTPRVGYSLVAVSGSVDDSSVKAYGEGLYYGSELGFLIGRSWGLNVSGGYYNGLPGAQLAVGIFFGAENKPASEAPAHIDSQP